MRKRFTSFLIGKLDFKTEEQEGKKYYTLSYEADFLTNHEENKIWIDKESYRVVRKETTNIRGDYIVTDYTLKLNEVTEEQVARPGLTEYTIKEVKMEEI